jgi:hypothetical protein
MGVPQRDRAGLCENFWLGIFVWMAPPWSKPVAHRIHVSQLVFVVFDDILVIMSIESTPRTVWFH